MLQEESARLKSIVPVRVAVTGGGSSRTSYELVSRLAAGRVFEPDVHIALQILHDDVDDDDSKEDQKSSSTGRPAENDQMNVANGLAMETVDMASGCVHKVRWFLFFLFCILIFTSTIFELSAELSAEWLHG